MTASMKQAAVAVRNSPFLDITHGHALELCVAILSTAKSWNHYCSNPTPIAVPSSIEDLFSAVIRGQRRLLELGYLTEAARELRCSVVESFLATAHGFSSFGQLVDLVLNEAGAAPGPQLLNTDWQAGSASEVHDVMTFMRLSMWYHRQYLQNAKPGDYPWDRTKALALSLGFTEDEACLIRSCQREAYQHAWPHHEWMEVGLLDPDQEAFLKELMAANWQQKWSTMLQHG